MWDIFFYAVIAVGALLFFGLLYYRIDWARHPEKYKDLENDEKNEYWDKKQKDRQMREKKAKDKAKAMKQPLPCRGREEAAGSEFKRKKVNKTAPYDIAIRSSFCA